MIKSLPLFPIFARMKMALHTRILLGMFIGIVAGTVLNVVAQRANWPPDTIPTITSYVRPVGEIFLRMIFMMVIPLIICALALGVSELGDLRRIGRVGTVTFIYSIVMSFISVLIGITIMHLFNPAHGLTPEVRELLIGEYKDSISQITQTVESVKSRSLTDLLLSIIPKNPIEDMARAFDPTYTGGGLLAVMFFSLILGIAMNSIDEEKVRPFKAFLESLYEIVMKIIGFAMQLAPLGVAALLFSLTASIGFTVFKLLLQFVLVVVFALSVHMFVTYSIALKYLGKTNPVKFFKDISEVMLTAFSTSSSNATLPTAIRVTVEKVKVPRDIAQFVLTIGSTANQNGTALYEGMTVLFLAACFNVDLSIWQQVSVVLMCVLAGIGTAGVPGGSLPVIALILATQGVPAAAIGIIVGVDRLLDMCRTTLNVTGDITAAVVVSKMEAGKGMVYDE